MLNITGKSYMTAILMEDVESILGNVPVYATATTNKAATVVADFGDGEAKTIHSLLGLRIQNNFATGETSLVVGKSAKILEDSFILIDEGSMLDLSLLKKLFERTVRCRFLIVGDADQLASVGCLQPPVFGMGLSQAELVEPMRFGGGIEELGQQWKHTVRTGEFTPIIANGVDVIQLDGEEFKSRVDFHFGEESTPNAQRIICWKNQSVKDYNQYIRKLHHDAPHFVKDEFVTTNSPILAGGKVVYATDENAHIQDVREDTQHGVEGWWYQLDKGIAVFQAKQDYKVKNLLTQLAQDAKRSRKWTDYYAVKEFFCDLRSVHACTTYKAQGSSYDEVYIDLADIGQCHEWQSVARQVYVAVTRAKVKVYLYGSLPPRYHNRTYKG